MKSNHPTAYCTTKQMPEHKDKCFMYWASGPDTEKPGITETVKGVSRREKHHYKNYGCRTNTVLVFDKIHEARRAEAYALKELSRKSAIKYGKEYYSGTSKKSREAILKHIIENHPVEATYKITPEPIEGVWKAPWGIFEVFSDGHIEFGGVKYTSRTIAKYLKVKLHISIANNKDIRDFLFLRGKPRFERIL